MRLLKPYNANTRSEAKTVCTELPNCGMRRKAESLTGVGDVRDDETNVENVSVIRAAVDTEIEWIIRGSK